MVYRGAIIHRVGHTATVKPVLKKLIKKIFLGAHILPPFGTSLLYPLLGIGTYKTRLTKKEEIAALIKRLHPIASSTALIRLGPTGDGGYLVPDDLSGIPACFSPGVNTISGFEKDCANLGMQVFLADHSVDGPALSHEKFRFTKKYVGATTSDQVMTMDDWVDASLPQGNSDLLLQMDIEGCEYETILCMSSKLMQRWRVMIVEFHDIEILWSKPFYRLASKAFEKILQTHTCVHIHPNNYAGSLNKQGLMIPSVMEFTFLRNDRVTNASFAQCFPHPLDQHNDFDNPHLVLPRCWFRT